MKPDESRPAYKRPPSQAPSPGRAPMPTAGQALVGPHPTKLLTIAQFSVEYSICRTRVYAELNAGRLEGVKSGRLTLIARESAEAWAARLPPYKPAPTAIAPKSSPSEAS